MPYKHLVKRICNHLPANWQGSKSKTALFTPLLLLAAGLDTDYTGPIQQAAKEQSLSGKKASGLKKDMLHMYVSGSFYPEEYVKYRFWEKTKEERNAYMSDADRFHLTGRAETQAMPRNKYQRYLLFQSWCRRPMLRLVFDGSPQEESAYRSFCEGKDAFVAKPIAGTKGKGVKKIEVRDAPTAQALHGIMGGECLLEGLITQGEELARFHPASVNTVRLVTLMQKNGAWRPLFALLRVGLGGSFVDNVGSGGLVALIDPDRGEVCTDALCGNDVYASHPDTQIVFRDAVIPQWDSLMCIAREVHASITGQYIIGFDFAWTDKGWDIVEINPSPSFQSYQALAGKGIRPLLMEH